MAPPQRNPFSAKAQGLRIYLESPCSCPLEVLPCRCVNCRAGKPCSWPTVYADCEHVLELRERGHGLDCPLMADEAGAMLSLWFPGDYTEPPLPEFPGARVSKEAEEDLFNSRADIVRTGGLPVHGLRHPCDVLARHVDALSEIGSLGLRRTELATPSVWARRMLARDAERVYLGPLDRLAAHAVARTPPGSIVREAARPARAA